MNSDNDGHDVWPMVVALCADDLGIDAGHMLTNREQYSAAAVDWLRADDNALHRVIDYAFNGPNWSGGCDCVGCCRANA